MTSGVAIAPRRQLHAVDDTTYVGDDGWRMARENGTTPNSNPVAGRWVLRTADGAWVDFDQYRHDLATRHNLNLVDLG